MNRVKKRRVWVKAIGQFIDNMFSIGLRFFENDMLLLRSKDNSLEAPGTFHHQLPGSVFPRVRRGVFLGLIMNFVSKCPCPTVMLYLRHEGHSLRQGQEAEEVEGVVLSIGATVR